MSGESGPLYIKIGQRTKPSNIDSNCSAVVLQSGTREAGTLADAFAIEGAANGATTTLVKLKNASFGQNTTITLTDPGVSATNLVYSSQVGNVTTASVTLTPAQVVTAYATPLQLVAAPGAGKTILIQEASVYTASTGNTAYATGTAPVIQYDSTAHGAGTVATSSGLVAGDITASASQVRSLSNSAAALTGVTNKGIFFSNATGAYTAGTGTNITISLTYQTITATV